MISNNDTGYYPYSDSSTSTDTTAGSFRDYVHIYTDEYDDLYCDYSEYDFHKDYVGKKKRGKKPLIVKDSPMPEYRHSQQAMQYQQPFVSFKRMFDKSGYLPKKIRRIRKCQM